MAEYYGLEAIGRKLGVSVATVRRWWEQEGLLLYRRRRGPRLLWYSNDDLLRTWELSRIREQREAWLQRKHERAKTKP